MLIRERLIEFLFNKTPCAPQGRNCDGGISYFLECSHGVFSHCLGYNKISCIYSRLISADDNNNNNNIIRHRTPRTNHHEHAQTASYL